mmetsp:Transcript_36948/g.115635  ORF Transcript_36948/g.115635 Transcript_36948/m.115635 type:complete len:231 (-) Transcript_36948:70-762(-)
MLVARAVVFDPLLGSARVEDHCREALWLEAERVVRTHVHLRDHNLAALALRQLFGDAAPNRCQLATVPAVGRVVLHQHVPLRIAHRGGVRVTDQLHDWPLLRLRRRRRPDVCSYPSRAHSADKGDDGVCARARVGGARVPRERRGGRAFRRREFGIVADGKSDEPRRREAAAWRDVEESRELVVARDVHRGHHRLLSQRPGCPQQRAALRRAAAALGSGGLCEGGGGEQQ